MTRTPAERRLLLLVLVVAAAVRVWGLGFGMPHVGARPDESQIAGPAVGFLSGDFRLSSSASLPRVRSSRVLVWTFPVETRPDAHRTYDQQDAFYLPLDGLEGISRPGPSFDLYFRR